MEVTLNYSKKDSLGKITTEATIKQLKNGQWECFCKAPGSSRSFTNESRKRVEKFAEPFLVKHFEFKAGF